MSETQQELSWSRIDPAGVSAPQPDAPAREDEDAPAGIVLTEEQQGAIDKLVRFVERAYPGDVFRFAGYAGTGKTTVAAEYLRQNHRPDQLIVAYTNKAASVLRAKGLKRAQTIHSTLYVPMSRAIQETIDRVQGEIDSLKKALAKGDDAELRVELSNLRRERTLLKKELAQARQAGGGGDRLSFSVGDRPPARSAKLIFIDEASMIQDKIMQDYRACSDAAFVMIGDSAQLEPVEGGFGGYKKPSPFLSRPPDVELTEVHRVHPERMALLDIATTIRDGGRMPAKSMPPAFTRTRPGYEIDYEEIDQMLCGTNRTRFKLVREYRRDVLGYRRALPYKGERLMAMATVRDDENVPIIYNGVQYFVEKIAKEASVFLSESEAGEDTLAALKQTGWAEVKVVRAGYQVTFPYKKYANAPDPKDKLRAAKVTMTLREVGSQHTVKVPVALWRFWEGHAGKITGKSPVFPGSFDYAYACTVHKAQGSEWDTVMVYDDWYWTARKDPKGYRRWLYTAVTRAQQKLIYVR